MNFTLKIQEYFIYTLIQITVKDDNFLLTFKFCDPPQAPFQYIAHPRKYNSHCQHSNLRTPSFILADMELQKHLDWLNWSLFLLILSLFMALMIKDWGHILQLPQGHQSLDPPMEFKKKRSCVLIMVFLYLNISTSSLSISLDIKSIWLEPFMGPRPVPCCSIFQG